MAQTQPSLSSLSTKLRKFERLEGTITATSGGVASTARLRWEAPRNLRIEIAYDAAAMIDAQTVVADGEQTLIFDPLTKRVQRLRYNLADQWWRSWGLRNGGPANVLLFGIADTQTAKYYDARPIAGGFSEAVRLEANKNVGRYFVRDLVRFGGGGDKAFHATFKYPVFDRPARIDLTLNPTGTQIVGRQEYNEGGQLLSSADLTVSAESGLPLGAIVRDDRKVTLSTFTYDLKPRTEPFPADTFKIEAPGQIVEDAELKPLAEYGGDDAAAQFNRGVVLADHVEDFGAAFSAWEEAARLLPQATAPQFAIYDAALAVRDTARATGTLARLSQLLGENNLAVLSRRANLALLLRDWNGAAAALDTARKVYPDDLGLLLQRAEVHRTQGEFDAAQTLILDILKSALPQPLIQAQAAEMLAAMSPPQTAAQIRQDLPSDTQWQRLARAQLALVAGLPAGETNLSSEAARASLAIVHESFGQDAVALPIWNDLLTNASESWRHLARTRRVGAAARRGDVETAISIYRELLANVRGEKAERSLQDAFIESWRKAFRQDELRAALQQRATATGATDGDLRLWLAYQETNGTNEEVAAALQLGLMRFSRVAWWYSHQAEYEMDQGAAQAGDIQSQLVRDRFVGAALKNTQRAIELDPQQPYYQMQRTLILTQRANPPTKVASAQRARDRATALSEVINLQAALKDDSDVMISGALQRLALDTPGKHDASVQLLTNALQGGLPGPEAAGEGRHVAAFAARQSLAMTYRRMRQFGDATRQYEIALDASAGAADELGVAINYLRLLASEAEAPSMARLITRLAREPWPFGAQQELMDGAINALLANRSTASEVAAALKKQPEAHGRLAAAQLYQALARPVPLAPKPPPGAPPVAAPAFTPQAAMRELSGMLPELTSIAEGTNKIVAARAAALLGEVSLGASQPSVALQWFQKAVAIEPLEPSLRLALAFAHISDDNAEAAKRVREHLLRILPPTTDNLLRIAALSRNLNLKDEAARLTWQAFGIAQVTPEVSPGQMQLASFAAARAAMLAGQRQRGTQIYNALALPQWDWDLRAAALLDLEKHLREGGDLAGAGVAAQDRADLEFSEAQLRRAELFLQSLN